MNYTEELNAWHVELADTKLKIESEIKDIEIQENKLNARATLLLEVQRRLTGNYSEEVEKGLDEIYLKKSELKVKLQDTSKLMGYIEARS